MTSVEELEREAEAALRGASSSDSLRELELRYLGKNGLVTGLLRQIGSLPNEEKPLFGQKVNDARKRLEAVLQDRLDALKGGEMAARFEAERLDVTMPARAQRVGHEHVLQLTMNRIQEVFSGLGFAYFDAPALEEMRYNFDALNYPPDHPAMDDQDTFYIDDQYLLRTQTTAFQGRILESVKPPFRFFTIGRCYRNEAVDRTHGHTFHQVDVVMVDEGVSLAHLKGTLGLFARAMFGEKVTVRFRPDFFPFVEPGVDYAISCPFCGGSGCPVCKQSGWIELGGAGLVHPNILEAYGIDTDRYSGFAFGLGVERIPMMAHGIDDLRHFMENDLRFLGQFRAAGGVQ